MQGVWDPAAEAIPTAAFWDGMDPHYPTYVGYMIHIMQGYQATMIRWANERPMVTQKSANATIGRIGRLAQHVALGSRCWAAGAACAPTWPLVDAQQRPGANPQRSMNHTLYSVECEGFSKDPITYGYDYIYGPAHPWPEPLIAKIVSHGVWFFETSGLDPDPLRIIGHRDTDGCTRSDDPGWAFPMVEVQERIAAGVSGSPSAPAPVIPVVGDLEEQLAALVAEDARQAAILDDHRLILDAHGNRLDRHLIA
jgi:hypothetical protein